MARSVETIDRKALLIMSMLREDHQRLTQLFHQIGQTINLDKKRDMVREIITAVEVHTTLEEELIYPVWREHVGEPDLVNEAGKEHLVLHRHVKELKEMDIADEQYDAKFTALSECVTHHMKEEERTLFPKVEKVNLDWERLTRQVVERRQILERKPLWLFGVPVVLNASEEVRATRTVSRAGRETHVPIPGHDD